jgi:hypothetical protein
VSLVVSATFLTDDGEFQESLGANVTWSPSFPEFTLSAKLPAAALVGTYTPIGDTRANVTMRFDAYLWTNGKASGDVADMVGPTSGGGGNF